MYRIVCLPGDGIGPEITKIACQVLEVVAAQFNFAYQLETALIGGAAIDAFGTPYPAITHELAEQAHAILLGAVGGPKWDQLPLAERPEKGLLAIRQHLQLYANLRPARLYPALAEASSLKSELVSDLDILIVRELTGGLYFGEPRGILQTNTGPVGLNTLRYHRDEIRRIGRVAFESAHLRNRRLCSVDKANVLETSQLWRQVMTELQSEYPTVTLSHMYVDNAAMQLVRAPKQFDVIVTENLFGDILSDCAAMLTGSIGMLPSASMGEKRKGLYEPVHGSAPDIVGLNVANPLATILSVAMMFYYSFQRKDIALAIEKAVQSVLDQGLRTADIYQAGMTKLSTTDMGQAVIAALQQIKM
jgi:3-isopropylmalate dehydrogenase